MKQPQNKHQQIIEQTSVSHFAGPLPHPDALQRSEEIVPGAAERILQMAEQR